MLSVDELILSGVHPKAVVTLLVEDAGFRLKTVSDVRRKYGEKVSKLTDEKILSIQINSLYHTINVEELLHEIEHACTNFLKKEKALHAADEEPRSLMSSAGAAVHTFALLGTLFGEADLEKGYDNLIELLKQKTKHTNERCKQ